MNLKEKILEILALKNFSYKQLSDHLGLSEKDLDFALEHNTLEIRTLELISKELRIPLYSFFRNHYETGSPEEEAYYNTKLWTKDESPNKAEITDLVNEIKRLKADMAKKDLLIEELKKSAKKN